MNGDPSRAEEELSDSAAPVRHVGRSMERVEDQRFLAGRGCFVGDLQLPGMLHAVLLRSPVAHGRLAAIDVSAAIARPGVRAVITAADIGSVPTIPLRLQPMASIDPFRQPVLAVDRVRYVGEPIAVVIADTAAVAEDALDDISVRIDPLPVVTGWRESVKDLCLLFDEAGTNRPAQFTAKMGNADAVFESAPYRRRETLRVQRHTALPMEPRGLLAEWDGATGRMTVYGAAKVLFFNRRTVAAMLGLTNDKVDLIENDVGGGFGARGEFYPEDFLIPYASRFVGAPVKWIEDRREHLVAMNHARECEGDIEIACDLEGRLLAVRGRMVLDVGAYVRSNGLTAPRNAIQFLSGPYRIPHIDLSADVQLTNKTPTGTYRAPGRFEANYFCERMLDFAARDLGLDPAEMRRRNLLREAEMPYRLAHVDPIDVYSDTDLDSGDYTITFDRCLKEFGWDEKVRLSGRLVDGRWHGVGLGCFVEGGAAGPKEVAKIRLLPDGFIGVYVGSASLGQGLETVLTQIAADSLEIAPEQLRIFHGSTTLLDEGYGSYHSRSTVMGGSAILLAASRFRADLLEAAASELNCSVEKIMIAGGRATTPEGRSVGLDELYRYDISVTESFENHHKHTYAYGTAAAHVAVDPGTGKVDVIDYLVVEDVGRIINPLTLHGQVMGATVQGLGGVFLEHLIYDDNGQLLTGTLADYLVPTASDFGNLRAITLEMFPSPTNPLGAKGAGEGGIIGVGGVIGNALSAALAPLGISLRDLPYSPAAIWRLIHEADKARGVAAAR